MLPSAPNFSRNVDWNLLKTFHEIAEAGGVSMYFTGTRHFFH